MELPIVKAAKQHDAQTLSLLQTVPGIGKILRLVLLYEMHDIQRCPRVQDVRLLLPPGHSVPKHPPVNAPAPRGLRSGTRTCKWAFAEAAVLLLRDNPAGQQYLARLEKKHGTGKALTVLAQQLGRAVYYMLRRNTGFDMDNFLHGEGSGAGEPAASLGHEGTSRVTVLCNDASTASTNAQEPIGALS